MARYRSRYPASEGPQEEGMEDLFGSTEIAGAEPEAEAGPTRSEKMAAAQAMGTQGNPMDMASTGLMMSGNPYAMGAGAGLKVFSMHQARRQKEKEAEVQEKQARIERQQQAISKLIGVSNSLRNL